VLFLAVEVANSGIGIAPKVRAKRAPDRLSRLLVAASATVKRNDGASRIAPKVRRTMRA
jgi:hypothetical protein